MSRVGSSLSVVFVTFFTKALLPRREQLGPGELRAARYLVRWPLGRPRRELLQSAPCTPRRRTSRSAVRQFPFLLLPVILPSPPTFLAWPVSAGCRSAKYVLRSTTTRRTTCAREPASGPRVHQHGRLRGAFLSRFGADYVHAVPVT